jgi:putative transposase
MSNWKHGNNTNFNLGYHLICCAKYRRKVLKDNIEVRLKELLKYKAKEISVSIETMEIMPDHVHLFVKANPVISPHLIVKRLKGYTSRIMRQEFIELRKKLPTLWTNSYYCESCGHISEDTVKRYIEEQKGK